MEIVSTIIAALAFALSCYTFLVHDRRLKSQEELLNKYQLRSLEQNEDDNKKAIIRAKAVKFKSGNRTLYINNIGKAIARNLKVEMPNTDEVYASNPEFPLHYDELLPESSREVLLLLSEGDDELTLFYEWEDDYSKNNSEKQTIDL